MWVCSAKYKVFPLLVLGSLGVDDKDNKHFYQTMFSSARPSDLCREVVLILEAQTKACDNDINNSNSKT